MGGLTNSHLKRLVLNVVLRINWRAGVYHLVNKLLQLSTRGGITDQGGNCGDGENCWILNVC